MCSQSIFLRFAISIVCVGLCLPICKFSLAQEHYPIKTEMDLLFRLGKADHSPDEVDRLFQNHPGLITKLLWQRLFEVAILKLSREPDRSFFFYDLALKVAERLKDDRLLRKTYHNIARSHFALRHYEDAKDWYLKSLIAFKDGKDDRDLILVLSDLGLLSLFQNRFSEAQEYSEATIKLAESFKYTATPPGEWPDEIGVAQSLRVLGDLALKKGDSTTALQKYLLSLFLLTTLHRNPRYDFSITESHLGIGRIYESVGDHSKALAHLNIAFKTARGEQVPTALESMGSVYLEQEDYAQARAQTQQALKIYRASKNVAGEATAQLDLAVGEQRQANYDKALDLFRQSLEAATGTDLLDTKIAALEGIGVVLTGKRDLSQALKTLNDGLALACETNNKLRQTELLWRMAEAYVLTNDLQKAEQLCQEAVTLARAMRLAKLTYLTTATLGEIFAANHKTELALTTLKESVNEIESLRENVAGREEELQLFFKKALGPYHSLVKLLTQQGQTFEALHYAELAKGRVLLDAVGTNKPELTSVLSQEEQTEAAALTKKLSEIKSRIKSSADETSGATKKLYDELDAGRLELSSFQNKTYTAHPELRLRSGIARPLTPSGVSALVANNGVAYLEYVVMDQEIGVFVLRRSDADVKVTYTKLAVNANDLRKRVDNFQSMLAERHPAYAELGSELYQQLLAPVETQLQNIQTICIVPDNFLWRLPFQALTSRTGKYLIEQYALNYAPSLSLLQELTNQTRNWNDSLIAFGNPLNKELQSLPGTQTEVASIRNMVHAPRMKVLTGRAADEKTFKTLAPQFSTIHLATHGVLDNRDPLYSHLLLTKTEGEVENDGSLEAREIMNLHLTADLVVLSACETGNGEISAGEGVIGMSWAFFVAGARSLVVSQWRVNSASTSNLMKNFYYTLTKQRSSGSKSEALRQASLRLMKDPRYRHPFYWAGFVLVGRN
jgi:CHAT domain-containing protein/tetratricopeptide (TPR) repeat protein